MSSATDQPPGTVAREGCPLCGTRQLQPAFVKDGIPYFDCPACGFRLSRKARNANLDQDLDEYEPAYLQFLDSDATDDANLGRLVRAVGPVDGTWLDVGCGGGKLVRFLAGDPRFHRSVDEVDAGRFAVVSAFDVVEHVPDPIAFLAALRRLASPTGRGGVATPDAASVTARLLGRRWW